jgi:uncharacterized protein
VQFSWDPKKAAQNLKNHQVSFATAKQVFDDPNAIFAENYFIDGEQRLQVIGMARNLVLLVVIYVDWSAGEEVHYRIISARKAEVVEESIYEDQIS